MAKEKSADPEKEARRAARAEKNAAKSSETNGVHKSKPDKKDKKDKKEKKEKKEKAEKKEKSEEKVKAEEKEEKIAAEAEDTEVTTKLLNKLEDTKPGSIVVKEDTGDLQIKVKSASIKGALVPFAVPLADEKAGKKVLKSVKKAAKNKSLKRGVKEVVKSLRKSPLASASGGEALAVVVLAADISPMDVLSHIPVLCEDHGAPYIFVTSRAELGAASATKRPTSVVMVSKQATGKNKKGDVEGEDFSETYNDLVKVVVKAGRDVKI